MRTLKLCIFSAGLADSKIICEPSIEKDIAERVRYRYVYMNPEEATKLDLSMLTPVTVRLTGCSYYKSQHRPCFVLRILEHLAKNSVYLFEKGLTLHLLPDNPDWRLELDTMRLALDPVQTLLPAVRLTLLPNFYYLAVPPSMCKTYIKDVMRARDRPYGNPFLLKKGSKVFLSNECHWTVTDTISTAPEADDQRCYTRQRGLYRVIQQHDLGNYDSDESQDDTMEPSVVAETGSKQLMKGVSLHYITLKTELVLLDKMGNSTEDMEKIELPYYFETPQLEKIMEIMRNTLKLLKKIGMGRTICVCAGTLVHGPNKAGKSALVEEAAKRLSLAVVKPADWVCSTAKQIKELFDVARKRAPCVVLLRAADVLFMEDAEGRPLIEALLYQLQEIRSNKLPVVLACTTAIPEKVSLQVRKVLGNQLCVPLPDLLQREDIMRHYLVNVHQMLVLEEDLTSSRLKAQPEERETAHSAPEEKYKCVDNEIVEVADENFFNKASSDNSTDASINCPVSSKVFQSKENVFKRRLKESRDAASKITELARATEGFTISDILDLLDEKLYDVPDDPLTGLTPVLPSTYVRSTGGVAHTSWDDIHGYTALKCSLKNMVSRYREDPVHHPLRGLLLYGPPGCGKTKFVRALVTETGFSYFPVMCSVIMSKYVGESEKNLSGVIQCAKLAAPSIVFLDDLDSLCVQRKKGGSGALIAELLSLVGGCGVQEDGYASVMFVGATNRPEVIDEGLLQSGFLERIVHVALPDCEARCSMWRHKMATVPWQGEADATTLCRRTEGYSGAEIESIYQVAGRKLVSNVGDALAKTPGYDASAEEQPQWVMDQFRMSQDIILDALSHSSPRTQQSILDGMDRFTNSRKGILLAT